MANSRSNIYPVQLQGAELCLNKYDAEIKQYSGFNKNNSPFVGGCLSNIFTKETEITSSSIFVDEEENVYTLEVGENVHLLKNNSVVKTVGNVNSWYRKEVTPYENSIRIYNEHIQLIYDVPGGYTECYIKTKAGTYNAGIYVEDVGIENIAYNLSTGIFIRANNTNLFVFAMCYPTEVNILVINADTGVLIDSLNITGGNFITDYPVALCYNSSYSQLCLFYKDILSGDVEQLEAVFFTLHSDNTISLLKNWCNGFSPSWLSSIPTVGVPEPKYWRFSGYPYNSATLMKSSVYGDMENGKDVIISVKDFYYEGSGSSIRPTTYKKTNNNAVKLWEDEEIQKKNLVNGVTTSMVSCYDYQHYLSETPTSERKFMCVHYNSYEHKLTGFSYSSTSFNGDTVKKGSYVMGDFVPLGDSFHLLFNNNQFSGIAGNQVLLSNWNSVELKTLCYIKGTHDGVSKESLCYKEGDKWYILYTGDPAFKVLGNQIVLNIDVASNAYDFKRDKGLSFAPAFNCVKDNVITSSGILFDSTISNNYIYAAAINEYKLEDNASIILNPINLYIQNNTSVFTCYTAHYINFYDNSESHDTNIKYKYSYQTYLGVYYDKNLLGLNFPADANGNVMYSPNLFIDVVSVFGKNAYIKTGNKGYPLVIGNNLEFVFSYYLGNEVEGLKEIFVIQGQPYVIINGYIYAINFSNGVINNTQCIVSVENLQYCGQTPYMALFFSMTNRCLYSFTGANVLNQYKLIDKISNISGYYYNPATQSNILFTDIGIIILSVFGIFKVDKDGLKVFILDNGVCFIINDNETEKLLYLKYYLDESDTGYTKENINIETSFYGMNNQTVTINDCLYFRIFSEEHEEGDLKVSATTISLQGRKTEETTFKIKASDWDAITHTIYLRYQPKEQRGLGVSFSIDSPFKIASLSVGSQADAILVDKVSKGAINAPQQTSNNIEW